MKVLLPPVVAVDETIDANTVCKFVIPPKSVEADSEEFKKQRAVGYKLTTHDSEPVRLITNGARIPDGFEQVLRKRHLQIDEATDQVDLSEIPWEKHPCLAPTPATLRQYEKLVSNAVDSWTDAFSYIREDSSKDIKGLRPPQLGAVHAAQSHFAVHSDPATIVMPTGTGKTETMLSILVAEQCQRLLVIVPTDALRTQIANNSQ